MTSKNVSLQSGGSGTALAVQIHPGAAKHQIENVDFKNGSVLIRLNSSVIQSEINKKLVDFLGDILGTPPDQIEIIAGHDNNKKLISIMNIRPEEVQMKLMRHLP